MEKREFIDAGRIVNTHGVAGEVKIEVWLDSPKFFRSFKRIYLGEREMKVASARTHKDFVIAKLEGIDDINAAMALKGREVTVRREDAALPHGAFFLQDILGARVVDEDGNEIGELVEIMERPASNVYVVKGETEHLIPAVPDVFIVSADPDAEVIRVRMMKGLATDED